MGKILDTITVFFKGNTDDLKKKKKEAEQLSQEAAANIKAITTATNATNTALDTTNKTLTTTEALTENIGQGIAAWVVAADEAANALNSALASDKARREQEKADKAVKATKKGADEAARSVKNLAKDFANVALGAFNVVKATERFKDVASTNLDLAQASRNFQLPVKEVYAYGQATKETGGDVNDYISTLDNLRRGYQKSGLPLKEYHDYLAQIGIDFEKLNAGTGRNFLESFGFSAGEINTLFATPNILESINQLEKQAGAIDSSKDEVLALHTAWNLFNKDIDLSITKVENVFIPTITKALKILTHALERTDLPTTFSAGPLQAGAKHTILDFLKNSFRYLDKENSSNSLSLKPYSTPYDQQHYGLAAGAGANPAVKTDFTVHVGDIVLNGANVTDSHTFATEAVGAVRLEIDNLLQYYNDSRIA